MVKRYWIFPKRLIKQRKSFYLDEIPVGYWPGPFGILYVEKEDDRMSLSDLGKIEKLFPDQMDVKALQFLKII